MHWPINDKGMFSKITKRPLKVSVSPNYWIASELESKGVVKDQNPCFIFPLFISSTQSPVLVFF